MITCISNSSQMLSGWVLGPHLLGILLAFRISWYRVNPYNSAQMTNMSIMMLCLFSQTFLANQTKTSYVSQILFFCITCFGHLALITCSIRLEHVLVLSSIILCNCTKEICNSRTLATLTLTTTFGYRSGLSWALKVYLCILDYEKRTIIVFLIFKLIANGPFQSACEYVGMLGDGTGQHWPFSAWQYLAMVEHWPFSTPGICPTRHSVTRLTNHSLRE